jgi:hypothetical protein
LNWDALLELADEHGVQGMLARRLEEANYEGMPGSAREKLQARVRAQHLSSLSLSVELFRILDDFLKTQVEVICVKGPTVSQVAYGDPSLRSFGDLDLLVRQRDIQAVYERMQAMGFEPDIPPQALETGKIPGEYVFRRAGTARMVEFHSEKTFRHYPRAMRIDNMMARKRCVQVDGRDVPALSLEDEVVFDCVHGGKDFWERLVWVADVAAIVTRYRELNWENALQAAKGVGADRMLLAGVQLAHEVLGSPVPERIASSIQADPESLVLCAKVRRWLPYAGYRSPGVAGRAAYRMQMAGGGITGAAYLARLSFSPTEDDWEENGRGGKSWLWETLRRPFRLIRKYGSGQ